MAEEGTMNTLASISRQIRSHLLLWAGLTIVFFSTFHLWQLALLVLSFGELPNYLTVHDWPTNIARIARMTPSAADMLSIMLNEWLIEVGSMNYAYGRGIAEWSFVIMPAKAAIMLVLSALLATIVVLLGVVRETCPLSLRIATSVGAIGGAITAGLATMTITWVTHCATPTWIVGLSILGVDTLTAFAVEPFGNWMIVFGFALLGMVVVALGSLAGQRPDAVDAPIRLHFARMLS
jgi:hypothetical protein